MDINEKNIKIFFELLKEECKRKNKDYVIFFIPESRRTKYSRSIQDKIAYKIFASYVVDSIELNASKPGITLEVLSFVRDFLNLYRFDKAYKENKVDNLKFEDFEEPYFSYSPTFKDNIFYKFDYRLGNYTTLSSWNEIYDKFKKTLNFIETNKFIVSEEVKNLKIDLEILNKFYPKYIKILDLKKNITVKNLKEFESELEKIEFKNLYYTNSFKNSIKYNSEYISLQQNAIMAAYIDIDKKIKRSEKTGSFYIGISGGTIALASLIIGNLSLTNANISKEHLIIYNFSILTFIFIFCYFLNLIYNNDEKTINYKLYFSLIGIILYAFLILWYKL